MIKSRNDEDMSKNKSKALKSRSRLLNPSLAEKTLEFDLPAISPKDTYNIENVNIMQNKGKRIKILIMHVSEKVG